MITQRKEKKSSQYFHYRETKSIAMPTGEVGPSFPTLVWVLFTILCIAGAKSARPNIVFFLADDLGYNDVSYHGSDQIPTPNIDTLCHSGVNFNKYYVTPMCTPSRISLLSGTYAFRTGHGDVVLYAAETRGLDTNITLMPQYLKTLGYATHLVGKWHIGHYKKEFTPTFRGFDSHLGPWTGHVDYYNHTAHETQPEPWENQTIFWLGHDFRRNMEIAKDLQGKYATDIFTDRALEIIQEHDQTKPLYLQMSGTAPHAANEWDPVQAPADVVASFRDIEDEKRRIYAGMVSKMDTSLGVIIEALDNAGMLDNTIIVFSTDNGGTTALLEGNLGSNWPLRGMKNTMWEGGIRGVGCMWSSSLKRPGTIYEGLIQITDWLPTLYTAIGENVDDLGELDGMSHWDVINNGGESPRTELFVHADRYQNISAYIDGDWKLVDGGSDNFYHDPKDAWYGESGRDKEYPLYSAESILNSKTAQAIGKYGYVVQSAEEIEQKRDLVSVTCRPPASNSTPDCKPCLYNLKMDPCEKINLVDEYPDIAQELFDKLEFIKNTSPPPQNTLWDEFGYPGDWDCTWMNFGDYELKVKDAVREIFCLP